MYKTTPELRKLQKKCLDILNVVDEICRNNNISYSLCGGSVIGAYLYGGFIPWDDDVDLMMTRRNYERFIAACRRELSQKYELQNYKTTNSYKTLFSKVVDKETTLIQFNKLGRPIINGVFLDITVYDKVPNNFLKKIDFSLANFTQKLLYCDIDNSVGLKKWLLSIMGHNCSLIYRGIEYIFRVLSLWKDYSYCELYGAFCNNKLYDHSIFEAYTYIYFEDKKYMIVKDYIKYLNERYEREDFYEPEDKQIPPHYDYVNLEQPYKEYKDNKVVL